MITLVEYAKCMVCDWSPDPTKKQSIDSQAGSHTKKTGHATFSGAHPPGSLLWVEKEPND